MTARKQESRDTYKYLFKLSNKPVHGGITDDLKRRENQHQQKRGWGKGHISQVGRKCTKEGALRWERDNGFQAN